MQPRRTPTPTSDASRSPAARLPTLIKRSAAAAAPPPTPPAPAASRLGRKVPAAVSEAAKARAFRRVLLAGLVGVGVGAGTAGVAHYLNRDRLPPRDPIEDEIHLPYPQMLSIRRGKTGLDKGAGVTDWLVRKTLPTTGSKAGLKNIPQALRWLRGDRATHWAGVPWAIPGVVAAGGTGLGVGSHVVKEHYRKQRKDELNDQLEQAKRDYEVAMLGQYDREKLHKLGAAGRPSRPPVSLDDVCDEIEKRANNSWGAGAGGYLTLAGLLAAGTGLGTKAYLDARSKAKLMADAIKHRALLRQMQNPPDVYVTPVPSRLEAVVAADPHANLPDPLGEGT